MDYNNYPTSGMGAVVDGVDLDRGADVSAWLEFDLHPALLRALQELGFATPTPIQRECLNPAIKGRCDVIGAAETGSGKTLAFGLPILNRLLTQRDEEAEASESDSEEPDATTNARPVRGEPFSRGARRRREGRRRRPLRGARGRSRALGRGRGDAAEAAPQSSARSDRRAHARARDAGERDARRRRAHADVSVVPVVGGMSAQKQERLRRGGPRWWWRRPGGSGSP